jgi:hypothetical protein
MNLNSPWMGELMEARKSPVALIGLVVAISVGYAIAHLCTSALPFQVGSLMEGYRFSATGAGLVGFFQVSALAVSMIVFAPMAHRFHPLRVCLFGMALAGSSNVIIYVVPPSLALVCPFAALAGTGFGLVLAAAVAAAAGSAQPDRMYAAGNSGALLLIVAMLSILPFANIYFGKRATFLAIPILIVVGAPLLIGFRGRKPGEAVGDASTTRFVDGLPLLAIWALFSLGTGAMWAFSERVGAALQLPASTIGVVLSSSVFAGLVGTGLAALTSNRTNRVVALGAGLVGGGASCLMFATASSVWGFSAAAVLYWVCTMFVYVYLLGTAALLDPTGRLGTLGTGCERLAFAVGAPIGGLIVDYGSYVWLGIAAAVICALIAPFFLARLSRLLRNSGGVKSGSPVEGSRVVNNFEEVN